MIPYEPLFRLGGSGNLGEMRQSERRQGERELERPIDLGRSGDTLDPAGPESGFWADKHSFSYMHIYASDIEK